MSRERAHQLVVIECTSFDCTVPGREEFASRQLSS